MQAENVVFYSWEKHRRSESLAEQLGIPLVTFISRLPRVFKYFYLMSCTIKDLYVRRPLVVFSQCPSIVLALLLVVLRPYLGYRLFIDAHNSGIRPFEGKLRILNLIYGHILSRANHIVITNEGLAEFCRADRSKVIIVPDPLPRIAEQTWPEMNESHCYRTERSIVFICTYAADEPITEVIDAAKHLLEDDVLLYFTGSPPNSFDRKTIPENVCLTGYLPDREYLALLKNSTAVLDLTYRENCIVCGAYEALALERPVVLSNTKALTALFCDYPIYCENESSSIASALLFVIARSERLRAAARIFRLEYEKRYLTILSTLKEAVYDNS